MRWLLPAPILLPLLGAAISMGLFRSRRGQRFVGLTALVAATIASIAILVEVEGRGPQSVQAGGWPAPLGITLVADLFSAMLLVIGWLMVLAVMVFAVSQGESEKNQPAFHPVYLVLSAGISASFLTGDLFNLFVAFEMMLAASYVLLTLGGTARQIRSGMTYVVISLIASVLFVVSVALIYAATGTVNMADLAGKMADLPEGLRLAFSLLLLVVFGIKAALFPLFSWLPDSYPTAPTPVTAVFAGLLTKVGIYAIIRTQTLMFPTDGEASTVILVIAALTMAVGVFGAIAQDDVKRILSFHIVSQIGYMVFGLGLFTLAGVAGAVLYIVHHIVVKTSLFLAAGLIERAGGESKLSRLGGMVHQTPVIAVLFLLPALSLAGIPPFSGFVAKLGLVQAGVAQQEWALVAVSLAVSALTLFSMTKIWAGVFWGVPEEVPAGREAGVLAAGSGPMGAPAGMILATAALVALSIAIALASGPLWDLSTRAAAELLDPSVYISTVFR
ncbi:MAG TPA: Na+/H+ antiporter subunit D [Actinomycetota bacterium]|nr:Na+/H+ antiporter subunit D [Actinomycetota bacterium]